MLLSFGASALLSVCPVVLPPSTLVLSFFHPTLVVSSCRPVVLSCCRAVVLSSCRPVVLSCCRPVVLSSCRPVVLSSCRPVVRSSGRPVVRSSGRPVVRSFVCRRSFVRLSPFIRQSQGALACFTFRPAHAPSIFYFLSHRFSASLADVSFCARR